MILVQIKGSNGSGKTTIVKQLLELDGYGGDRYLRNSDVAGNRAMVTINPNVGWAAVGQYTPEDRMGGCDRITTVDNIKLAIRYALDYCLDNQDYMVGVVFEGMMISTIKSTFYAYLQELQAKYDEVEPLFVILKADVDGCVRRIEHRGTKRAKLKVDKVADKCTQVVRHALTYNPELVRWIDVEQLEESDMIVEFLKAVGDLELLELC